jgi:hypothetical protein
VADTGAPLPDGDVPCGTGVCPTNTGATCMGGTCQCPPPGCAGSSMLCYGDFGGTLIVVCMNNCAGGFDCAAPWDGG